MAEHAQGLGSVSIVCTHRHDSNEVSRYWRFRGGQPLLEMSWSCGLDFKVQVLKACLQQVELLEHGRRDFAAHFFLCILAATFVETNSLLSDILTLPSCSQSSETQMCYLAYPFGSQSIMEGNASRNHRGTACWLAPSHSGLGPPASLGNQDSHR